MMKLVAGRKVLSPFRGGSLEMLSGGVCFPRSSGAGNDYFPVLPVHLSVHVWSAPPEYFKFVATRLFVPSSTFLPGDTLRQARKRPASSFGNAQAMTILQSKENINETADLPC